MSLLQGLFCFIGAKQINSQKKTKNERIYVTNQNRR